MIYSPFRLIEHPDKRSNRLIVQYFDGPERTDQFDSKRDLVYSSKLILRICSIGWGSGSYAQIPMGGEGGIRIGYHFEREISKIIVCPLRGGF